MRHHDGLIAFALLWSSVADAGTLYVSTSGSDAGNACADQANPCATIAHGIASMAGGDTLVVADGTYAESIDHMPSGSASAYTTIAAAHDWGVTIDGSGFANDFHTGIAVSSASYVAIRGFHVVMNQANDNDGGVGVFGSDHVKIQRCSVAYAGTVGNVAAFDVGPASDHVLVEESYAYGGARYPFLVYQSTHTVMRRNVSRLDTWSGSLQAANFTNYNGDMTVWENNIAIDSDNADIGGSGLYGGFFDENKVPDATWSGTATRETFRGNVVLHVDAFYSGMYDYDVSNLHTYSDNIIWDSHGGYYGDYIHGDAPVLDATRFTIGEIGGTYSSANGQGSAGTGVYVGPGTSGTLVATSVTSSILWNNPYYGIADHAAGDYNSLWNNGTADYGGTMATPAAGAHDRTDDLTAGLRYLPRVEPGSVLATAGADGGSIGANVELMWGATGTLWGEPGYDTVTTEPLWPFPNEAVIGTDMASYVGPGAAGQRGFTAGTSLDGSPQTLTKYIWEYLGNPIPADVYGFHVVTQSLPSGSVGTAYQAPLTAAGGPAPYAWSATGLPPGLTLDAATGVISGTPDLVGTSSVTVTVTDASAPSDTAIATLQLEIDPVDPIGDGGGGGCGCRAEGGSAGGTLVCVIVVLLALRSRAWPPRLRTRPTATG